MSDERYETLPLPLLPCVAMCWVRNGSNSLISSRQPRKSLFDVDPNIWSSPLNGRPLLDKNFTTDTMYFLYSMLPDLQAQNRIGLQLGLWASNFLERGRGLSYCHTRAQLQ